MYFEYWQPIEVKVKNGWFDYLIPFIVGGLGAWLGHFLTIKRTNESNEKVKEEEQLQQRLKFYRELKEKDYSMNFFDHRKVSESTVAREYFNWEVFSVDGEMRKIINQNFYLLDEESKKLLDDINRLEKTHILGKNCVDDNSKYCTLYVDSLYKLYGSIYKKVDEEYGEIS